MIKNHESKIHKAVAQLSQGRPLALLTGTPLSTAIDAYAYVKLLAPGVYKNFNYFKNMHVKSEDDYGNVREWENMDLLAQNMTINTSRIFRREVNTELPIRAWLRSGWWSWRRVGRSTP